ncbi:MAG: glycosyltransferase family 39 protein [Chloroflexota bacterium]
MTDSTLRKKITWFKRRWLAGLLGLVLMIVGQTWITIDTLPDRPPLKLGAWLTEEIHLAVPGIDNALYGLPLLLIGGVLLGLSMRGIPLLPPEREFSESRPFAFRQLAKTWPWVLVGAGLYTVLLLRLNVESFRSFHAPVWLASLALFAIAVAVWDLRRGVDLSPQVNRTDLLWIIGLLFGGLVVGAYRLQGLPDGLIGDEGNFWGIARDIAIGEFKPSVFAVGVYTFPVFSSILPAWFIRLFGVSLWGWRLSSVLTGLLTVPPLYLLMREMFNRKLAVASAIVLVASPYFIAFSRLGYNNIQALFVTALALYWLYLGLHRKSSLYLYLAGCAAGLGFYVYFAARMGVVIALLFIFLAWVGRRLKFREAAQAVLLLLVGFALFVAPHILYGLQHDPQALGYKAFESVFFNTFNGLQFYSEEELYSVAPPFVINDNQLFYHPRIYLELLARGFIRTMLAFQRPWLISEHYIAFPLAGSIGALFYVIGLAGAFLTIKQPRSQLVLLWFFVNALGLSALNTVPPRHTHMVALIPALAILATIGIQAIAQAAAAMHSRLAGARNILFASVVALAAIGGLYDYFIKMPPAYRPHPDQVVLWTGLEAQGETLYYIYTDPAEAEYMPHMVTPFRETVVFEPVAAEDILSGARSLPADRPSVALFPPDIKDQTWAALQQQWGASFLHKTFYSAGHTPILAAGMNTPFVFERDKTLDVVLKESYLRPSLIGLFAFLIALGAAIIFLPASWRFKMPNLFRRFVEWFNAPGQPDPQVEEPDYEWEEIISAGAVGEEEPPPQLPDWATDEAFPTGQPGARRRFGIQAKTVKTESGRDIYIKVFFPRPAFDDPANKSTLSLPPLRIPNAGLLTVSVLAAFIGQILVHNAFFVGGILSYLVSMGGLLAWGWINRKWRNIFSRQLAFSQKAETIALALLFLVMFVTRFADLSYRVYGLEADETKWTAQSWYSAILRLDYGEFHTKHYTHLPVVFWVRSLFLRVFGVNFLSARIESAVGSLISVMLLYYIVRAITGSPAASLLSALLYGFSFIELNLSHQALHDTPSEPWMMASIFALFLAIQGRKAWQFQLTGVLLALGMLVYETFYPTPLIVLAYLSGMAVYEIVKRKTAVRDWVINIGLALWPAVLIYIIYIHDYLLGEQAHHFAELAGASDQTGLGGVIGFALENFGFLLQTTFSRIPWTDSLLNWDGPLVNPLLLPFVAIGLVYTFWNIRRPHYAFILLWYLLQVLPGPILLGTIWPRVLFTAAAPLMIWGALGLWTGLAALRAWLPKRDSRLAALVFTAVVIAILVNDYTIFSSRLIDPPERQKRRELADLTAKAAHNADLLLLPYIPYMGDSVQVETHVILMSVAGAKHKDLSAENNFQRIEFEQLLPALWEKREIPGVAIVFDKSTDLAKEEREKALRVALACYPQANLAASGRFFDVYELSPLALTQPTCYHPPAPELVAPKDLDEVSAGTPPTFTWNTNGLPNASFALTLERKREDVVWLEAEDNFIGDGWYTEAAFAEDYSGLGFLIDDWQSSPAIYDFHAPLEGPYHIWVRYYKREDNDQRNYLSAAGQAIEFAENGVPRNEWTWKDVGVFHLPAGPTPISLSRVYGIDGQYSIFIDTIVITSDPEFQPARDQGWQAAFTSGEVASNASQYSLPSALAPGEYRWTVRIFDGNRLVDSSGERGIQSPAASFLVPGIR